MPGPVQSVFIPVPTAMGTMIAAAQANNSPITDYSEGSVNRTLSEGVAIVLSNQSLVADQLQKDSFLETATEEALDAIGAGNWLVPRKPAVQASGVLQITRESTSGIYSIPSGLQLQVAPSVLGGEPILVQTLANAEFAGGAETTLVNAQAVLGGIQGNLTAGTFLTPVSPIAGINSTSGYVVHTSFTGGVNVETDEEYRARIPIAVQGRVKGTQAAYEAAALGVPGVLSVGVIKAGQLRGNGTAVAAGHVEVYYQGSSGLLSQVTSAVAAAATTNQEPSTFASISLVSEPGVRGQLRVVLEATVYYAIGVSGEAVQNQVIATATGFVNMVGIGNTLFYSELVEAIHTIPEVVSIALPLTKLAIFPATGAANIPAAKDSYVSLAAADCHITTIEI